MTLGASEFLHLLWLVPLIAAGLWFASRARSKALATLFSPGVRSRMVPPGLERRRAWQATLTCLGLALILLAAAQPRWGFTWRDIQSEGVEIVIALDVSLSMDANDVDPNRLERAKREVLDLLEIAGGDRVGLVIFAGGAYPRIPLTLDHDLLRQVVRDLDTMVLTAQGSSLTGALIESAKLFDPDHEADRAVILISDGEVWDDSLDNALTRVRDSDVRVYALGVGTPDGSPIPDRGGGFKTDQSGQVVMSRLEESALQTIASETGGAYVRSTAGAADVEGLLSDLRGTLDRKASRTQREKIWDERFQWPLAGGIGLLMIAALIGDGRGLAAAAALLALTVGGPAHAGALEDARSQLDGGDADAAVQSLTELRASDPDDVRVLWTLAEALSKAGRYEESRQTFEDIADRAVDSDIRLDARYNAGNAAYGEGKLQDAVESWQRVLEQAPEHAAAKANSEAVQQELAQRMQDQQEQDPSQDQQDQDQEQEQQDGEQQEQQSGESDTGQQDEEQQDTGQSEDEQDPSQADQDGEQKDEQPQDGEREEQEEQEELSPEDLADAETSDSGEQQDAEQPELEQGVGAMSPEEAEKLLEGAEEGRPRVIIRGESDGKDW